MKLADVALLYTNEHFVNVTNDQPKRLKNYSSKTFEIFLHAQISAHLEKKTNSNPTAGWFYVKMIYSSRSLFLHRRYDYDPKKKMPLSDQLSTLMKNYASRTFQRFLHAQKSAHLEKKQLLTPLQDGFISKLSIQIAVFFSIDDMIIILWVTDNISIKNAPNLYMHIFILPNRVASIKKY